MGLAEVQEALARLYIDPALRDRFFADPAAVGAELGLVPEEALDLARVPRRQVEQFADSLRRKRRDQVRRVIPITARALGRRIRRALRAICRRVGTARVEGRSRRRGRVRRGDRSMGRSRSNPLGRRPGPVRAGLATGRAGGPGPIVRMFRFPVARLAARPRRRPSRLARRSRSGGGRLAARNSPTRRHPEWGRRVVPCQAQSSPRSSGGMARRTSSALVCPRATLSNAARRRSSSPAVQACRGARRSAGLRRSAGGARG